MESQPIVYDFNDIIQDKVHNFTILSEKIGGNLSEISNLASEAFQLERQFIIRALTNSKPSDAELSLQIAPISQLISKIEDIRGKNRSDKHFNHLSAVSESIGSLGWICQEGSSVEFVKEMQAASQFYLNRVLKDFKEVDRVHVDWVQSWTAVLTALSQYIVKYHRSGLPWNLGGQGSTTGAPPPPPPVPSADIFQDKSNTPSSSSSSAAANQRGALFSEINRGTGVTAGLKKVTADMQTHKNPELRGHQPVPAATTRNGGPPTAPKPSFAKSAPKPTKLELVGNKWVVEHFVNKTDLVIGDTEAKHTVYVFKCDNCCIQIQGKINSIVLDSCKKTGVVFDDLISSLDVVNCQSVKLQVQGKMPTVNIDKTDGCQVYLSRQSMDTQIVSAKSSEMNVLIPNESGDYTEYALPEQFKTHFDGKKLITVCSEDIA